MRGGVSGGGCWRDGGGDKRGVLFAVNGAEATMIGVQRCYGVDPRFTRPRPPPTHTPAPAP